MAVARRKLIDAAGDSGAQRELPDICD